MKKVPFSLRLSPELDARLEESARRIRTKKHTLAQMAIESVVEAIEANNYKLAMPLEFLPKNVVVSREELYPSHRSEAMLAEDRDLPKPKKKNAA